jgi:hypothetical protein
MKKSSLLLIASSTLAFAFAVAVSHVPTSDSSDEVACGDSDAKKKKGDKKDEDEKS